ncbi:TKL protein kinase [Phytophthora palmivora]|uniref:TKL protein kinase n=1 Tax=Phytophthora palmivora TaxID=4796 RepID=A0A2P4YK14_9STRA|nr:TKL protein kinase [Phytophthora palmivora]
MAANLLDLAVLGLGSALTLLGQLYTKFSQLKEGRELCISLHDRLKAFADELKDVAPETLQSENLLPQLQNLIREFADTVTIYAESNFAKRVMKADKFAGQVKIYNERLDSIVAMLSVNRTVLLVEWRSQFQHDSDKMISELATINKHNREIWMAIKQLPTKKDVEDMVLVIKRELLDHDDISNPESIPSPLDPVMHSIVNVAEKKFLDGKAVQIPPPWLIAADEVTTAADPIDSEGQSEILVGDWQGVPVAIKRFNVVDDNPVFDKHFRIWRTLLHPHVAQLYGAGSHDGAPFFAYEYSEKQVWRLLYQAAVGLEYLHKKHVVHGNLSCSKFLVTDQGDIKLFGFGASYVRIDNRSNSIKPETREEFAAPECIGIGPNSKDCGFRHSPSFESGVYSFGLTIMEAVAKKHPLDGMTLKEILALKRQNQLRRPEGMSGKAWNLVQQMCVCDPTQRVSLTYVKERLARGDIDRVKNLIGVANEDGNTPLIVAARRGHLDVVEYLVDLGVDIDKQDSNGNTPLLLAARWGKLDVVQYLVEEGADIEIQNKSGRTPLIWAALNDHLDVVKYLVEQGAFKEKAEEFDNTPLMHAAGHGHLDVVRYLVEQGVDKDKRDCNNHTALMWAVVNCRPDVVKYLVEQGADKEVQNKLGHTPLIWAATSGNLDEVRCLVEHGVEKDKRDYNGKTALIWAAANGKPNVVKYLVDHGADKDVRSNDGGTPLMWAALHGHLDVVRYLVEQGVNKDKRDYDGLSSLSIAAVKGHIDMVRYLVEQGADMYGKTAVIWAAQNGNLAAIQKLIRNKADPTGLDNDGNSVLLVLLNHPDITEDELVPVANLLLEHGTPLLPNNEGKSAGSVAEIKGFRRISALVKEYSPVNPGCDLGVLVKEFAPKPQPASASLDGLEAETNPTWFIPPDDVAKVGAALACTGLGMVYRAKWAYTDVVVKEVSVVELRRFLKEVNTWRNLRHTNVVPFYGANHRKEPYFIVSQYAAKGELVPYLKSEKDQGRNIVWRKFNEIAAGLGYLHSREIVHGDLKGNNIVVNDNGTAMLTDFGLSFQESGSCSIKDMKDKLGAMAWRAPEFAHMTVMTPTRKSDVYSLGMCIIEAVTLKNPWSGYDNEEIRHFLRNGVVSVTKPDEMTESQWELVEWMIAVSPDDRPNLSEVVQKLEEFANDEEYEHDQ